MLLLEPHSLEAVRRLGEQPRSWYSSASGLFSNRPHLYLTESFWDAGRQVTTIRYFIADAATGDVTRHASSMQAYSDEGYQSLLADCGFDEAVFHESLGGPLGKTQGDLLAIVARRR